MTTYKNRQLGRQLETSAYTVLSCT